MRKTLNIQSPSKVILFVLFLLFFSLSRSYALEPVKLNWDANANNGDLAGYKVYYGTQSRYPDNADPYSGTEAAEGTSPITILITDPGFDPENPEYTLTGLDDKAYFFAVTAFNNKVPPLESYFSNEEATLCISWPEGGFYVNDTNDSPYRVWGRADNGNVVQLSANGTLLGTATADDNRDWWVDVDFEQQFSEGAISLIVEPNGITAPAVTAIYDKTKPTSTVTSVAYGTWTLNVAWTASDEKSGVETSGVATVELWHKWPGGMWNYTGHTARERTIGTFYYTPTHGDAIYYFATRSVDKAGNWEVEPSGDGDTNINYIAPINSGLTGKERGGGCFIEAVASP